MSEKDKHKFLIIFVTIIILVFVSGVALFLIYNKSGSSPDTKNTSDSSSYEKNSSSDSKEIKNEISKEEAENIALDKFGGKIKETESDHSHGKPAWEVEIYDSKEGRIEVKVDKKTGEILDWEHD